MRLLRVLGIGLGMLLAVGFGLCGASFVKMGVEEVLAGQGLFNPILLLSLAGLVLGVGFGRAVWLALKQSPDADRPPKE